ncbi:hypothetical protein C5167_001172 [Papaver somniferum]|uniref:Uncharacterized protein n=1 Tax=Papaver somniferum TaxID=3469 RepID=A0A4Y7KVQ6_PAPSO|nr:hypothetical protein C5167_001172 [Papaver somniferum]
MAPQSTASTESTSKKRNTRGISRGVGLERLLAMTTDRKLPVKFKESAGEAVCFNRSKLAIESGVIVRSFAPLEYKSWIKIPLHDREALMERVKFWVDLNVPFIWDYLHRSMGKKYNSHRSLMCSYFKSLVDSSHSIEQIKANPYKDVPHDKWEWLCNHFSSPEFKKRSLAGSKNREKVQYNHCSGSMAFVVRHEQSMESENHSPIQVFHDTHTRVIDKTTINRIWLSDKARSQYDQMIAIREQSMEEGSEPRDEGDICAEVLGKKKARRRVAVMQSNQETEELREKVRRQEEEIRKMKEDQALFQQDVLNRLGLNVTLKQLGLLWTLHMLQQSNKYIIWLV